MKRKTARKNSNVAKVVQILLFTTVIVVCITFSKYKTALGGKATAIIGNPKTTVVDEVVLTELKPGDSITSNFKVKNFDENKTSDISMVYTIKLETEKYLPLNFELKKVENGEIQEENLLNNNITQEIEMPTDKYEQEYQLTVSWNGDEKNYLYSNEIDCVKIIVDSYQKAI